jgi:CoA:oxalate CoA-transferase
MIKRIDSMEGAVEGLRVVEIGQWIAAPYCCAILADLGADVIKIERPGRGDDQRHSPPFARGQSALFSQVNRNKRSVTLDLTSADGVASCKQLARVADVVIDNYRSGSLNRLGITYEALSKENPRLIYCAISGFGQSGPLSERAGMDLIAQSMSGLADLNADETGQPKKVPMAVADIPTGLYATIGILAALAARERTGKGQFIDVSLLESTLSLMPIETSIVALTGQNPRRYRERGFGNASPYQMFPTGDGWIALAAASQPLWESLCRVLDRGDLAEDGRFSSSRVRIQNSVELERILGDVFKTNSTGHWLDVLDRARIPAGPVLTTSEILAHPHMADRGFLVDVPGATAGLEKVAPAPIHFSGNPTRVRRGAPELGEHTEEVLAGMTGNRWPA